MQKNPEPGVLGAGGTGQRASLAGEGRGKLSASCGFAKGSARLEHPVPSSPYPGTGPVTDSAKLRSFLRLLSLFSSRSLKCSFFKS